VNVYQAAANKENDPPIEGVARGGMAVAATVKKGKKSKVREKFTAECTKITSFRRLQRKLIFSQATLQKTRT